MQCIPAMTIMVITLSFSITKQTKQSVYKYMIYMNILISTVLIERDEIRNEVEMT